MVPPWVQQDLDSLEATKARRELRPIDGPVGPVVRVDGRDVVCFSSNDYLGLATHPNLAQGARDAVAHWGSGSGASRLITGTLALHERLEAKLAAFKGAETALLFGTGYQANVGVLQGLMSEGVIFSDALNHASIVDGCRLARATVQVYAHGDVDALVRLLRDHRDAPRKMIATDGVFSMDGDIAPLDRIVTAAEEHGAMVLVDDAHATGVIGEGRGTAHHFGLDPSALIQMGTLGKALGSFGAFVACPSPVRDLLVTRARSFVYTTSPPGGAWGIRCGAAFGGRRTRANGAAGLEHGSSSRSSEVLGIPGPRAPNADRSRGARRQRTGAALVRAIVGTRSLGASHPAADGPRRHSKATGDGERGAPRPTHRPAVRSARGACRNRSRGGMT